ncbi:hypothetical protein O181_033475 [Austropuccinia psidii MF-1]|uniref:Uncharacterized protein n=1 Tax=Austropuccinia psidii MF-1 TaxID=1389203 RepID=A0A9Q3D350_9BASI|nr:hypothetical protein [Austropuccinia psidii MF-1]
MEGEEFPRTGGPRSRLGEHSDETKVASALKDSSEASNMALVSQAEPNLLKMLEKTAQFMEKATKAVSPRDTCKDTELKGSIHEGT